MKQGELGFIATPLQGNARPEGVTWAADNGCFGKGYPGDEAFLEWLARQPPAGCKFAVAPDVVGDHEATEARALPLLRPIKRLGYRVAYVAQDGLTPQLTPWLAFDALFIGGSTEWKMGPAARELARGAYGRGKWVHMGRVNTWSRLQYARDIGCNSVDGTFLKFGPNINLPILLNWLRSINTQTYLLATH